MPQSDSLAGVSDASVTPLTSETSRAEALGPVVVPERIASIDVIRGFALLGILAMNIISFGLPSVAYERPSLAGGFTGANFAAWLICFLFFEGKMMSLFSMLFGAGLVLMSNRAEERGRSALGVYYRRVLWLLVFGLIHGYLIWVGDILYTYAVCGLGLYLFRRRSPTTLIVLAVLLLLMSVPLSFALSQFLRSAKEADARVEAQLLAGKVPSATDKEMAGVWRDTRTMLEPSERDISREIAIYHGSYLGIVRHRAGEVFAFQTWYFIFAMFWAVGGRMLLGMALMKLGVFSASRSTRFYVGLALLGYGIGLPIVALGAWQLTASQFDPFRQMESLGHFNAFGSILVALGHAAAVILILKTGGLPWLTRRLAAVGRMALSNYLFQSIVCTTLFYGYGFGLFARLDRAALFGVVFMVWIVQLLLSPIWLSYFRFGPAEWLWRSLTYWKLQPIRAGAIPS